MTVEGGLWRRIEQLVADDEEPGAVVAALSVLHAEVTASRAEVAQLRAEQARAADAARVAAAGAEEALGGITAALTGGLDDVRTAVARGSGTSARLAELVAGVAALEGAVRESAAADAGRAEELRDGRADLDGLREELARSLDGLRLQVLERLEEQRIALARQLSAVQAREEAAAGVRAAQGDRLEALLAATAELRRGLSQSRDELPQFLTTAVGGMQRDLDRIAAELRADLGQLADGLGAVQDGLPGAGALAAAVHEQVERLAEALREELVLLGVELHRGAEGLAALRSDGERGAAHVHELREDVARTAEAVQELREDVARTAEAVQDLRDDLEGGSALADQADDALLRHLREQEQALRGVLATRADAAPAGPAEPDPGEVSGTAHGGPRTVVRRRKQ